LNARRFAQRYPDLVSGLVLVDAAHVDQLRRIPTLDSSRRVVARQFQSLTRLNALGMLALRRGAIPARGLANEPARRYRSVLAATAYFHGALSELDAMPALFAAQPEDSVTLNVPVVVVSRGRAEPLPRFTDNEDVEREWRVMQREFLALSNRSTQVVATHSAHDIHIQEPQVVTDAIMSVLNALPAASLKQARGHTSP
jgi:pimeloyl-ACP methyl ester carboxylesterase